jgi:secreted trypsin-like serine protease
MKTVVRLPTVLLALLAALVLALPSAAAAQVSTKVVGGTNVTQGNYPWQVALLTAGGEQYCGGTLVDEFWVLTARHCEVLTSEKVLVGSVSLTGSGGQEIEIDIVKNHPLSHPGDDDGVPRYDLTMVKLAEPATHPDARPLAIVAPGTDNARWAPGVNLTVTGWGRTLKTDPADENPPPDNGSNTLREAQVPRVSDATCASAYQLYFDAADMVCAGLPEGGRDTCQGDSGGPIVAPVAAGTPDKSNPDHWRLVGATSWGFGCAWPNNPGVYARLGNPVLSDWTSLTAAVPATPPTLSGLARAGETVTCSGGTFTGRAFISYRFYRQGVANPIASNTTGRYTLGTADVGSRVSCRAVAQNAAADVPSSPSNESDTVVPRPVPVNTAPPSVVGEPVVGRELRCAPGTWTNSPTVTYAFRRVAPTGAATPVGSGASTYVPTSADLGMTIVCVETATNEFGRAEASSAPSGPVAAPPPPPPPPDFTDRARPVAALAFPARCVARRCTVAVRVADPFPSAGVASVRARISYRVSVRCRRGGRRARCVRTRTVSVRATQLTSTLFRVRTGKLPRGRVTIRVTVTDNAGFTPLAPIVARLRVR